MPTCFVLSFLAEHSPTSVANHRAYADSRGYPHYVVDACDGPRGPQALALHKYQTLLDRLHVCANDDVVLLLTESALIVGDYPIEPLVAGRDELLVRTTETLPQVNLQIWRNGAASRERLARVVARCRLGGEPFPGEPALFADAAAHDWYQPLANICVVMNSSPNVDPAWARTPTLAISLGTAEQSPPELLAVPRFRRVLAEHIQSCRTTGRPFFHFEPPAQPDPDERSTYDAGQPIALVTLYTPEIARYGAIAEHNLRQYCARHGYTLYVHRGMPQEVGLSGTGNWIKPWLLHAYLQHHSWVVWVDADVLIHDPAQRLEPLLADRTVLLARDIGQWPFNSGVMGFAQIPANLELLALLMQRIASLADRSSVYAGNGDQHYFIQTMRELGLLDETAILSPRILNTPWFFAEPDSFLVHYYGMWPEMRTLMMDYDERRRLAAQPVRIGSLPCAPSLPSC
ncbi:galactosyl transferase GMA12/MNN10 domain protein [Burkholderia vietnamiensis]|uniref:galactosyl transferase GMA12/MNN10 domain protein n=1 Tax=Burkholderia vietnamiensis TaxID=60552 RepID=UPI00158D3B92|nr:galactosyl transferase GMA12/MNN10 domain protein [Burkholderia vietnamiensis]